MIGINVLRHALSGKRLFDELPGLSGLQRNGYVNGKHAMAVHINDGSEIYEAAGYRNVGRIQSPDLVGVDDC